MFEDTIEQELSKYEKFKDAVDDGEAKQAEILEDVKVRFTHLIINTTMFTCLLYPSYGLSNFY